MNNWKEQFKEQFLDKGSECTWSIIPLAAEVEDFITATLEKLIEDIPDTPYPYKGVPTKYASLKSELRDKWLSQRDLSSEEAL